MKPNAFLVRQGTDDFEAYSIGHMLQSLPSVDVVSVVFDGRKWHVFAKYSTKVIGIAEIDKNLAKLRDIK